MHSHRAAGYVASANVGPDSNASQFYITLSKARWLDNRNVVFGKVVSGMVRKKLFDSSRIPDMNALFKDVVERLARIPTDTNGRPTVSIVITDSGMAPRSTAPFDLTETDLDNDGDFHPSAVGSDFIEL